MGHIFSFKICFFDEIIRRYDYYILITFAMICISIDKDFIIDVLMLFLYFDRNDLISKYKVIILY